MGSQVRIAADGEICVRGPTVSPGYLRQPPRQGWLHQHGSPGHGRDHVLPALVPPYATIPVLGGRLALGTWQSVCLVDTNRDNPVRRVRLSFVAG